MCEVFGGYGASPSAFPMSKAFGAAEIVREASEAEYSKDAYCDTRCTPVDSDEHARTIM